MLSPPKRGRESLVVVEAQNAGTVVLGENLCTAVSVCFCLNLV